MRHAPVAAISGRPLKDVEPETGVESRLPRDFSRLWAAETASALGDEVTGLALPLIAIGLLAASPIQLGILAAAGSVPFLVLSLPVGAWLDRRAKRLVLIVTDLGRGGILALIPIAAAFQFLSMPLLYAVAAGVGVLAVPFGVAQRSYLPFVVPRALLGHANSRLEVTLSSVAVIGPTLAGAIIGVVGAPRAILVDCFSYLASATFVHGIESQEPPAEPRQGNRLHQEIADGIRYVLGQPVLRALVLSGGLANAASAMWNTVYVLFMVRQLGLDPLGIGLIFGLGNIGLVVAAPTIGRITNRLGIGRAMIAGQLLRACAVLLIPLALIGPSRPILVIAGIVSTFSTLIYLVNQRSLRQAMTPDRLQGRVTASTLVVTLGIAPIGSITGGLLAQLASPAAVFVVAGLISSLSTLPLLVPAVRRRRLLLEASDPRTDRDRPGT
jgi:MFS family permease